MGLASDGRRRSPGLRREEVAVLANISVSWYTLLEQGRDITVSDRVLDAVSAALQLTDSERAHLYVLAGANPPAPTVGQAAPDESCMARITDGWSSYPAYFLDRYWNIWAANRAARAVFGLADGTENRLITFFTRPDLQRRHHAPERLARRLVAELRLQLVQFHDDAALGELVEQLYSYSARFAALWDLHELAGPPERTLGLHHPHAGDLYFEETSFSTLGSPDRHLVVYTPEPGTGTAERLAGIQTG